MQQTQAVIEARSKWIQALESGNYKQTHGVLKDTNGYCCLGVACEELGVEWMPNPSPTYNPYQIDDPTFGKPVSNVLDTETALKLNITTSGEFVDDFVVTKELDNDTRLYARNLWQLNDSLGWDFKRIAEFLKNNWDKLRPNELNGDINDL